MDTSKPAVFHRVVIACHFDPDNVVRCGPLKPLIKYFLTDHKVDELYIIEQPHPYCKDLNPRMIRYITTDLNDAYLWGQADVMWWPTFGKRHNKTSLWLKLRDFFSVLYFCGYKKDIDLFIGVESVNAVAGGFLFAKKLIYYIFDWSPHWFKSKWLNKLYLWFDRQACKRSDKIWNITGAIKEAREELGYASEKEITIPYCMPTKKKLVHMHAKKPYNKVAYCGWLSWENGSDLLSGVAMELADEGIELIIIGEGEGEAALRAGLYDLKLQNVKFLGKIDSDVERDKILASCHIGLAPCQYSDESKKMYGDLIKIRNYFACGLPVVLTEGIPIAEDVKKFGLGSVTRGPFAHEIAEYCKRLLRDDEKYNQVRSNVLKYARKDKWNDVFNRGLK